MWTYLQGFRSTWTGLGWRWKFVVYTIFLSHGVVDSAATWYAVGELGFTELNPLVSFFMTRFSVGVACVGAVVVVGLALVLLVMGLGERGSADKWSRRFADAGVAFVLFSGLLLTGFHSVMLAGYYI